MHHEQDMRKMGGLRKYMPITYWTCLVGCLALIGFPGTSGFFSKDSLIDAVHDSHRMGSGYAYICVLTGVFITALYTFRMFIMTFLGKERMDHHTQEHLHESPWVVTVPLILLAIPSALIGWFTVGPMLFAVLRNAIHVAPAAVLSTSAKSSMARRRFMGAFSAPPVCGRARHSPLGFFSEASAGGSAERRFYWLYTSWSTSTSTGSLKT